MDWLFGSVEDQAEREYQSGAYTPGKGRKKDWGDHIGDFLTGNRGAAIDRAVEQQHVKKLTRDKGILLGELNAQPNVNIGPITKDTDELVLDQQIAVAKPKAQAALSSERGEDISCPSSRPAGLSPETTALRCSG